MFFCFMGNDLSHSKPTEQGTVILYERNKTVIIFKSLSLSLGSSAYNLCNLGQII